MMKYLIQFCWLLVVTTAACSSGDSRESGTPLRVFAATSLTSVLPQIATAFQELHSNAKVEFNFAASSILAKQIERGAEADIYLSANLQWMEFLQEKQMTRRNSRSEFLANELVLIAQKKQPQRIASLQDLLRDDVQRIALAGWSHVPAGMYAKSALENFGIWQKISSKCIPSLDVRAALTYVERGDADCGVVYRTDALISNTVLISTITKEIQPEILYSAAITETSGHALSTAFLAFLQSKTAEVIFTESGFVIPESESIE